MLDGKNVRDNEPFRPKEEEEMQEITDKHEMEQVQAELLSRLINDWALLTAGGGRPLQRHDHRLGVRWVTCGGCRL